MMNLTDNLRLTVKKRIAQKIGDRQVRVSRVFQHVRGIVNMMREEGAIEYIRSPDGYGGFYKLTDYGRQQYLEGAA